MNQEQLISELTFKAVRSSGSGGQHVNKVATKIELQFNLEASSGVTEEEKEKLKDYLKNRLTKSGILILQCSETRSQLKNKQLVIKKFIELIREGLIEKRERIPTKTPKAAIKKRLQTKRLQAQKKASRKKPDIDK